MKEKATLFVMVLCALFGSGPNVSSQEAQVPCPCASGATDPSSATKPTVYITYDHAGNDRAPAARLGQAATESTTAGPAKAESARSAKFLWLCLHNNTPWTIAFPTESMYLGPAITAWHLCDGTGVLGLRDGLAVNAYYQVDSTGRERSVPPIVPGRIDVIPTSWLPPHRSVLFQVERAYVSEEYSVYLSFNYEWETQNRHVKDAEPEHRAYFHASMLPREVR
jgi:hypothetical protein